MRSGGDWLDPVFPSCWLHSIRLKRRKHPSENGVVPVHCVEYGENLAAGLAAHYFGHCQRWPWIVC